MSMSDPIADMLTRIRNGLKVQKRSVSMPASRIKESILKVLHEQGYIDGFEQAVGENGRPILNVELKYYQGRPVIERLERVSRPGRRVYRPVAALPSVAGGLGVAIVSTSKGVMTGKQARQAGAGGEILCTVF